MKSSLNLFIFLLKTQTALIDYIDDNIQILNQLKFTSYKIKENKTLGT